jgi:hypothetical protein
LGTQSRRPKEGVKVEITKVNDDEGQGIRLRGVDCVVRERPDWQHPEEGPDPEHTAWVRIYDPNNDVGPVDVFVRPSDIEDNTGSELLAEMLRAEGIGASVEMIDPSA